MIFLVTNITGIAETGQLMIFLAHAIGAHPIALAYKGEDLSVSIEIFKVVNCWIWYSIINYPSYAIHSNLIDCTAAV